MPTFNIFAARDGDTFRATIDAPDEETAREQAVPLLVDAFGLDWVHEDDVISECDGFELEEVERISKETVRDIYLNAKSQFEADGISWVKKNGEMTQIGRAGSMCLLYGIDRGLKLAGHPDISGLVFLAGVRGAEEVLNS